MVTAETMKCKPVEEGVIFLNETEFKEYVHLRGDSLRKLLPKEEADKQEQAMLTGKIPPTFFKWEVRCRPN